MDARLLEDRIRALGPWHHDVEIAPGLSTGGASAAADYPADFGAVSCIAPFPAFADLIDHLYPSGLEGRSFLDCACNGGGYVLAAKRHGAGRAFGFDAREHWIRQARFLAEHLRSEDVGFETMTLDELPGRGLGPFDITMFKGLFYHLPDPVAGLKRAADHTSEILVLDTAAWPGDGSGLRLNRESDTDLLSGVDSLAWLPTGEKVLHEILAWCGFPHSRLRRKSRLANGRDRIEIVAARKPETLAHYDSRPRAGTGTRLQRLLGSLPGVARRQA